MVSTQKRRKVALQGKLRQRGKNGQFHYRLQVAKGVRKEFALKTTDPDEAVNKAFDLDSLWLAPTVEVAYAHRLMRTPMTHGGRPRVVHAFFIIILYFG